MNMVLASRSSTHEHTFALSDTKVYPGSRPKVINLSPERPLVVVRPQPPNQAASLSPEVAMSAAWEGTGRPSPAESAARRREFLRLLAAGSSWKEAADQARISPKTVLTLIDQDDFWTVAKALRDGRADHVAVTIQTDTQQVAA